MALPILPLVAGIGSLASSAGGLIGGLAKRDSALDDLERRAKGQGLASRAAADRASRRFVGAATANPSANPVAAIRAAQLAGQEERNRIAEGAAREQAQAQQALANAKRQDADLLTKGLAGLGNALAGFGAAGQSFGVGQGGGAAAGPAGLAQAALQATQPQQAAAPAQAPQQDLSGLSDAALAGMLPMGGGQSAAGGGQMAIVGPSDFGGQQQPIVGPSDFAGQFDPRFLQALGGRMG